MLFTNPPRVMHYFEFYGSLHKIQKKKVLPFWWLFWGSVEFFLKKYTIMITIEVYTTNMEKGVMVIKKNKPYHTTFI